MRSIHTMRGDLLGAAARALLALFLIPLLAWWFAQHALLRTDRGVVEELSAKSITEVAVSEENLGLIAFYQAHPPSLMCRETAPELAEVRQHWCAPWGEQWQFYWMQQIARAVLIGGALLLLAIGALAGMALRSRAAQIRSVVFGRQLLVVAAALEVVLQCAMLVWLSYWGTAYVFHVYYPYLILIVGGLAVVGVSSAIGHMFAPAPDAPALAGELVSEADAPQLWARIRALAVRVGTAPPDHVVAGIDTNFFVTGAALRVQGGTLQGRSLYVSLPLLGNR